MPPRRPNKKKKVKSRDRNEKATCCHGCSKQLDKDNFVYCVCTQVRFCSASCQEDHPHNDCTGPPENEFDMRDMMRNLTIRRNECLLKRGMLVMRKMLRPFRSLSWLIFSARGCRGFRAVFGVGSCQVGG